MEVRTEAQFNERSTLASGDGETSPPTFFARTRETLLEWNRGNGVIPFGARAHAPALVWLVAMGIAAPIAPYSTAIAASVAATGVLVAVAVLRGALAVRALTALAMLPGASPDAPAWAWVLSGGIVALLVSARGGPVILRTHDLQRHLDWCRRREEKAHVLVMRFSLREVPKPARVLDSFRTTDSIAIHLSQGVCELQAVLDDQGFSREGVERRIIEDNDASFRFGWAAFPDDGVTLDSLMETARAELVEIPNLELQLGDIRAESYA
jgi:hypothetical protein